MIDSKTNGTSIPFDLHLYLHQMVMMSVYVDDAHGPHGHTDRRIGPTKKNFAGDRLRGITIIFHNNIDNTEADFFQFNPFK